MNVSHLIGLVGTGLVIVGYVPQIYHLIKERCTVGLSLPAFAVWSLASLLFLIHAALIRDVVFIGVQVVNLVAGGVIVAFCKKYDGQVCPYHLRAFSASARTGTSKASRLVQVRPERPALVGDHTEQ